MRSTFFHSSLLVVSIVSVGVGLAPNMGCSDDQNGTQAATKAGDSTPPATPPNETSVAGSVSNSSAPQFRGSPLCQVNGERCTPDDEEPQSICTPDAAAIEKACRITRKDGVLAATCVDGVNRDGVDGVACKSSSECALGFECVEGDLGGVCRRYCCTANTCADQASMNGGPTFCDIRKVAGDGSHYAPVCMPLKKCKLLQEGVCAKEETCAVVTDKSDSGCVPVGNAKVGDSCDEEHCEAQLTCLGSPGDRRCFKLCRTDRKDCGESESCTTSAVFQNPEFGVCQPER